MAKKFRTKSLSSFKYLNIKLLTHSEQSDINYDILSHAHHFRHIKWCLIRVLRQYSTKMQQQDDSQCVHHLLVVRFVCKREGRERFKNGECAWNYSWRLPHRMKNFPHCLGEMQLNPGLCLNGNFGMPTWKQQQRPHCQWIVWSSLSWALRMKWILFIKQFRTINWCVSNKLR